MSPEPATRPTLQVLPGGLPKVEGFDGELTTENMRLLLERIADLEDTIAGQLLTVRMQAGKLGA